MNRKYFERILLVNNCKGQVFVTGARNQFALCCSQHADEAKGILRAKNIVFYHEGILFTFAPEFELSVKSITQEGKHDYHVVFNGDVAKCVWDAIGTDQEIELFQDVIESVEERVINGIFGPVQPAGLNVEWVSGVLVIKWGKK